MLLHRIFFTFGISSLLLLLCAMDLQAAEPDTAQFDYIVSADSIIKPLNNLTGNATRGREVARDQHRGNCLTCHHLPIPEEDFHGNIGPSLYGIGARLSAAQIRLRVADIKQLNPFSIMPGFYRSPDKINRIAAKYAGTTILSAQDVEDIVAYLSTLQTAETGD